jgi:hypothetical protein
MSEGLVGGEGFAIDPSVVKADATRARGIPGVAIDNRALGLVQATRAVREYLEGIEADGRPEIVRKSISVTDPPAEWTCAPGLRHSARVRVGHYHGRGVRLSESRVGHRCSLGTQRRAERLRIRCAR